MILESRQKPPQQAGSGRAPFSGRQLLPPNIGHASNWLSGSALAPQECAGQYSFRRAFGIARSASLARCRVCRCAWSALRIVCRCQCDRQRRGIRTQRVGDPHQPAGNPRSWRKVPGLLIVSGSGHIFLMNAAGSGDKTRGVATRQIPA